VAGALISARNAGLAVAGLLLVRAAMAAFLPLSADEAYYWLWSRHLAAGYYDHPPAIAFLIRIGTLLFGDSEFGVRFCGVLLSIATSWFIWQTGLAILRDGTKAALAVLLFNLTLMTGVEMLAVTPDTPSIAATAAFLFCLAKLQQTQNGRWWLWAGMAAGLGLLSKYSGLFAGAGAALWLLANPRARSWLTTFWPWAGGVLALLIFLPNLWWQSQHQWMTFAFQFGRVSGGHLTLRFLGEFIGAQLGMATPFLLMLAVMGAWAARRRSDDRFLLVALMAPALVYFLIHALHDRVQGNWPAFLYPMLAILAADAFAPGPGWRGWCARLAMPVAAAVLLLAYLQAAIGLIPLKHDPLARLLGVGMRQTAEKAGDLMREKGAQAVLTTDYETTAWLRFYNPSLRVMAVQQPNRYLDSAPVPLGQGPFLYLADGTRGSDTGLVGSFEGNPQVFDLQRERNGRSIAGYKAILLNAPQHPIQGKSP
jgi:4-amino-4-deoxy-L-arabinose transferase-like glycosyltransferase